MKLDLPEATRVPGHAEAHGGKTLYYGFSPEAHAVQGMFAGTAAARVFAIDETPLRDAVASPEPGRMRGERIERNGTMTVNDCYHSNPDAARTAVPGEMLDLGRWAGHLHRAVGEHAARCGNTVLVGIRGEARALVQSAVESGLRRDAAYFFNDPVETSRWRFGFAERGDAILFKGSRGTGVDKAFDKFLDRVCG